jgi:hypothetical protein
MRFFGWMLIAVCPIALIAQDKTSAVLQAQGNVTVNGSSVQASSVTYGDDKIETGKASSAHITQKDSVVSVAGDSRIVYNRDAVQLERGEAVVGTRSQYRGRIKNLTVSPTSKKSRYRMTLERCEIRITALAGSVQVDDGKHTLLLEQGKTLRRLNEPHISLREDEKEVAREESPGSQPPSTPSPAPTGTNRSASEYSCPALLLPHTPGPGVAVGNGISRWIWFAGTAGPAAWGGILLANFGTQAPLTPSAP